MAGPGAYFIGEEEKKEVLDVLESGYLFRYGSADDPNFKAKVCTLEQEISDYVGVNHCLAVNSGTMALVSALAALGIGPGDEVIVPGYTFIASIGSIIHSRAIPVLCEINESLTMDPSDVESKITPRTKAIMPVHMLGNPCDMDAIMDIARKHNLKVIEDCAQAFGASYRGKMLGSIGDIGIYSFNVYKTITAGDGGAVVTNNHELHKRAFAFHDQGHSPLRQGVEVGSRPFVGLDLRMTELTGAVLLAQFRKLDSIIKLLREKKARFKRNISGNLDFTFRRLNDSGGEIATILTVIFDSKEKAQAISAKLGSKTVDKSGWHVYNNMEQILHQLTVTPEKCPFTCPLYEGNARYYQGMLPKTDDILSRAMNISIGVSDGGLGAGFGIIPTSDNSEIDFKAAEFLTAVNSLALCHA